MVGDLSKTQLKMVEGGVDNEMVLTEPSRELVQGIWAMPTPTETEMADMRCLYSA